MRLFKEIFDSKDIDIKTLPILHSCEAIILESILMSKELKPHRCDVFGEDHLYAFYGIPSYRKSMSNATSNPGYFPVCFILNYDLIPVLDKLYPFDTGAFRKIEAVREDHFHSSVQMSDLEMAPSIEEAKKIVNKFYLTNENYVRQRPQLPIEKIGAANAAAYGYASMIHDKSLTNYDTRVATIELIYKKHIELNEKNLMQIILPAVFLDDLDICNQIENIYNIKSPLVYETIKGSPSEYFGVVYNLYLNFIKQNSLL